VKQVRRQEGFWVDLHKKFENILARERQIAKSIALSVMESKPLGVWDVTIPVIFILNFMRQKQKREIFSQNILFTKKLALEAALDIKKKGTSRKAALSHVESKTRELLDRVKKRIYSNEIRRQQIKEVETLIDHYCRLLEAKGEDYPTMVRNAYGSEKAYLNFLDHLQAAEKEVTDAAKQTLGELTDEDMVARIEATRDRIRHTQAREIFSDFSGR
jgi:hypothetical protein